MSSIYHKRIIVSIRLSLSVFFIYSFFSKSIIAQEDNHRNSHQLVIGDLVGRTDTREMKIHTKEGYVSILGSGNNKPFELIQDTPKQLLVQFHMTNDWKINNPTQVLYKFYETERALISALILDEVDFAILENEVSALEVKKSNDHFLPLPISMVPNRVKLLCYNNRKPFLKMRKVRQALAYAINHDYIINRLLGSKAHLAKGPFDSDSPIYASGLNSYNYHPKKAIQLLKEAGWRDSDGDGILDKSGKQLGFNLFYQKGLSLDEEISRLIKINLIKIGVDVTPKPLSKSKINDQLGAGNFDAILMDYTFNNKIESIIDFFSADGSQNYMGYRSSTLERYLKSYYNTTNPTTKETLLKSMQVVINKDQPVKFLYFKWLTHYMLNIEKFDNYRDKKGNIRPFEEWIIKSLPEK